MRVTYTLEMTEAECRDIARIAKMTGKTRANYVKYAILQTLKRDKGFLDPVRYRPVAAKP